MLSLWLSIILGHSGGHHRSYMANNVWSVYKVHEHKSNRIQGNCKPFTFLYVLEDSSILRIIGHQDNNKTLKTKVFSWMLLSAVHSASSLFRLHNFPINYGGI